MFELSTCKNKKIAVFGLGRSGLASALALKEAGANVIGWDENQATRKIAKEAGVEISDFTEKNDVSFDSLVISPGVPIYGKNIHKSASWANQYGIPIIGDIELFAREINAFQKPNPPKIIGITGTNGKSTTTALIGHILSQAGLETYVGGNIGTGVMNLPGPKSGVYYVLELSSYQLDLTTSLQCNVAIQINISEDHLERHETMERYVAAKRTIFNNQTFDDTAVIGIDDDYGEALCTKLMAQARRNIVPISSGKYVSCGVYAFNGGLYSSQTGRGELVVNLELAQALIGAHNGQNAAAAYACCQALGLNDEMIARGMYSFPGLKHRLSEIGRVRNVRFFNDSKATNADATKQALAAFSSLRWIVGGRDKSDGIDSLAPYFPRIKSAYLIGEAAPRFSETLEGKVEYQNCQTMKSAVNAAFSEAIDNGSQENIVLSPACASFDQYKDFEARGDDFINIVNEIIKKNKTPPAEA